MELKPFSGKLDDDQGSSLKSFSGELDTPVRPTQTESPKLTRTGFVDSAIRGFKRSLPETKSLLAGAGAAVAGAVGADGLRDKALEYYREVQQEEVEPLANKASFTGVLKGEDSLGEWAGDTLGNFGGQALQSLAAAGAGAAVGSVAPGAGNVGGAVAGLVARPLLKRAIGKEVAEMVAKDAAKDAIGKAALKRAGMVAAPMAMNIGQETGIAYTGRADDAAAAGEELSQGDAMRAIAAGVPAGVLDTAAEALTANRLLRGASESPKLVRRVAAGAAQGALTEGATEAAQAVLERAGAAQDLTGQEAYQDYIENAAAGALGGGVVGGGSGVRQAKPALTRDPQQDRRQLPAPDGTPDFGTAPITVAPDGTAATQSQSIEAAKTREEIGLTPDVNAARASHPGAVPNAPPVPFPDAQPGSLADAANVVSTNTADLPPPAPDPADVPPPAPWIDATSGKQREATDDELKAYLHDAINRMSDRGIRRDVIETNLWNLGVTRERTGEIWKEVAQERKSGLTEPAKRSNDLFDSQPEAKADAAADSLPATNDAAATGSEVAPKRPPLSVRMNGQEYPVESYEDASRKFQQLKDAVDIGGMKVVELIDEGGNVVGNIQQNGSVLPGDYRAVTRDTKPLYEPPGAVRRPGRDIIEPDLDALPGPAGATSQAASADQNAAPPAVPTSPAIQADASKSDEAGELAQAAGATIPQAEQQPAPDPQAVQPTQGEGLSVPTESDTPTAPAASASSDAGQSGPETRTEPSASVQDTPAGAGVQAAAAEAATSPTNALPEPTDAQKEAGNYKKGHVRVAGLDISIENPAGTSRRPEWPPLENHYGYIKGTIGKDKDHVDVFLTDHAEDTSRPVFVVDQYDPETGKFDEHKVVLGAATEDEARAAYQANYAKDWQGLGAIREFSQDEFKTWVRDQKATTKPAVTQTKKSTPTSEQVKAGQQETAAPRAPDNAAVLNEFFNAVEAQLDSGKPGRVEFPAAFKHVTEVENARNTLRDAFIAAGGKNLGGKFGARFKLNGGEIALANSTGGLWADITIDKDAQGSSLFSRPDPAAADGNGARATNVRAAIAPIVSHWSEAAPNVVVVDTAHDLPAKVRSEKGWEDIEGWYDDKDTVYLVAGNLTSDDRARRILAHEAVGHFGIEAIVGETEWAQIRDTVYRMMKSGEHNELFAEISRRYKGVNEPLFVREAVAVMAEKGMGRGIVSRVAAAIRRFLRSIGFDLEFNERELRDLIGRSARYLRDGRRPRAAPERGAAMSFAARPDRDWNAKVPVVGVAGGAFGDTNNIPKARKAAKNYLTKLRDSGRKMTNADTGWRIGLSAASIKELIQFDAEKLNLLLALPRITNVAILADTSRSERADTGDTIKAFHTFYAPVSLNGEPRIARLVVREDVNGSYAYDLQQSAVLKDGSPAFAGLRQAGIPGIDTGAGLAITVRQLRDAVNAINRPGWNFNSNPDTADSEIDPDAAFVAGLSEKERQSPTIAAYAEGLWRAMGTDSPFFQHWFDGSKVVSEDGKPMFSYHGTAEEFAAFDPARLGKSTNHMTAALGIFFDTRAGKAEHYARIASNDVPAEQVVLKGYLAIKNPYSMSKDEFMSIDSVEKSQELRAKLERDGFDGIKLPEIGQWIAFKPEQFKAVSNRGTFDPADSRMKFSRPDKAPPEGGVSASDDARVPGEVQLDPLHKVGIKGALQRLGSKITDLKPKVLALVPLQHMADFTPKRVRDDGSTESLVPAVDHYVQLQYDMQAMRNGLYVEYDKVAQDLLAYSASGAGWKGVFGRAVSQQARDLFDLMHDSTIAGIDPSVNGVRYKDQTKAARYAALQARFNAIPEEGQRLFKATRDAYAKQTDLLDEVIESNATRAAEIGVNRARRRLEEREQEIDESDKTAAEKIKARQRVRDEYDKAVEEGSVQSKIMALRKMLEANRVQKPYFPLKRYGKYWVSVLKDGKLAGFSKFETSAEQEKFSQDMVKAGYQTRLKFQDDAAQVREMIDPEFVAEVEGILAGLPTEIRDEVWQAYLERMPDMSLRKSFIHRQNVQGYHFDALKAFGSTMFHGSYQIARLKYGMEMQETLDVAGEQAGKLRKTDSEDAIAADMVIGELKKRHSFIMNPTNARWAQKINGAAFLYSLGANPAHLFMNATQTVMLGMPILGSRYGFTGTANALQKAVRDFAKGKGHIDKANLTDDERRAFEQFQLSGLIEKTQAHDIAGIGAEGVEYSAVRKKVMDKIGWFMHQSERFNREVTAMAAYRLARNAGHSHNMAIAQASKDTRAIHFDYTNSGRARILQSDLAKALLVFRNYQANMIYRLFRDIHQSMRGESVQVKREARKQLGAMFGMYAFFAGAMGVPFYGLAMALAGAFDDDDDPVTAEQQFVNGMVDFLGPDAARYVLNGLPGALFDVELSSRIGMPDLWMRSPDRELEGRDAYFYWMEQLLGAGVAPVKGMYDGINLALNGNFQRGVERAAPAALRNPLQAIRMAQEGGVTSLDGDLIKEVNGGDLLAKSIGFTPLSVAEQYDTNSALKNADQRLSNYRQRLLNRYYLALQMGDETTEAMADIAAFNAKNPEYAITRETIARSQKLRNRNRMLSEHGIVMTRRMRRLQARMNDESEESDEQGGEGGG